MIFFRVLNFSLAFLAASVLGAWELSSKGDIQLESRLFREDGDLSTYDGGFSQSVRLETSADQGSAYFRGRILARADIIDDSRDVVIVEEAYLGYSWVNLSLDVGAKILNWSTTEAFHPADIINARNYDSNLENAEKIGEPMVHLNWLVGSGALNLYFMPYVMAPRVPAASNRLSFFPTAGPSLGDALYIKRDGKITEDAWIPQGAAKLEQSFGELDIALFWIAHQTRDQLLFAFDPQRGEISPVFMALNIYGVSTQQAVGDFLIKSEWAYRETPNPARGSAYGDFDIPNHGQVGAGIEYTWYHRSGKESTFIVEGQTMLGIPTRQQRNSLWFFQRDMLLGWRLAFNDTNSKILFVSVLFDLENEDEYLASISYEQRLSDVWGFKMSGRVINAPVKGPVLTGLQPLDQDHNISMTLTRYF